MEKGFFSNDVKEGTVESYYKNGVLKEKVTYSNGNKI